MKLRSQPSKRRWKARARAGKWIPALIVFVLDQERDLHLEWEQHPTERGFMRLKRAAEDAEADEKT